MLSDNDGIHRGRDDKHYCWRNNRSTGLIVGGIAGRVIGNDPTPGRSETREKVIGAVLSGTRSLNAKTRLVNNLLHVPAGPELSRSRRVFNMQARVSGSDFRKAPQPCAAGLYLWRFAMRISRFPLC